MPTKTKAKKSVVATKPRTAKAAVTTKPQPNNPFKGKSKSQICVMIAEDVLAQLKAKTYVPTQGCWTDDKKFGGFAEYCGEKFDSDDTLKTVSACDYVNSVKNCTVCALGSIFVSQVRLGDSIKVSSEHEAYDVFEELYTRNSPLTRYFSDEQLMLIEACFEGAEGMYNSELGDYEGMLSGAYELQFPKDKDRLKAIMENVVRNKGKFMPAQDLTASSLLKSAEKYL